MRYLTIILAIFTGEFFLKNHIEKTKEMGKTEEILGGRILVRKYHNEGACMNLGEKRKGAVAALSLVLTAALSVVFLFTLTRHGRAGPASWRSLQQYLRQAETEICGGLFQPEREMGASAQDRVQSFGLLHPDRSPFPGVKGILKGKRY